MAMDTGLLLRVADFFFTAIAWLIAGSTMLVASAMGQGFAVMVALAIVLTGVMLASRVMRS